MRRLCFATLALGLLSGCGLADYEKRMDEQRDRLKTRDEENAALGDMLDMPSGKDAYGEAIKVPFNIFLRPPLGVTHRFAGAKAIYQKDGDRQRLYRYAGNKIDVNMFVAWASIASKPSADQPPRDKPSSDKPATDKPGADKPGTDKSDSEKPKDDEALPEEFRAKVRDALLEFIRREYGGINATFPDAAQFKKDSRQVLRSGKLESLAYESAAFDDPRVQAPARYFVFFHARGTRQAAVIYQAPVQSADQNFLRVMEVSLKTLEITFQAQAQREQFLRTKR